MQFRKKPVVVEAITFDELVAHGIASGGNIVNGMPWSFHYNGHPISHENDDCYLIPTLEGTMKMHREDMLITGVNGEIYPCKRDIFEKTYEPANLWMCAFCSEASCDCRGPLDPGPHIQIKWQEGPIKEHGVNGCQVEDVIQVAIDRLRELNQPPYNSRENSLAITDLESAQNWLHRRTREREARQVEGTSKL